MDAPILPREKKSTGMRCLTEIEFVVCSSSGAHGFVFEGILRALEDHVNRYAEWRQQTLRGLAGTSGGAICALAIALGLEREHREPILKLFSDFESLFPSPDIVLLVEQFGLEQGNAFRRLIRRLLVAGGLSAATTLRDLDRLLRIDVVFVAHDLRSGMPVHLSAAAFPDMLVADAVFASCCIPFMFAPVVYGDMLLCDGCMSEYVPSGYPIDHTLYLIAPPQRGTPTLGSWPEFLLSIVRATVAAQMPRIDVLMQLPLSIIAHDESLGDTDLRDVSRMAEMIACGYRIGVAHVLPMVPETMGRVVLHHVCLITTAMDTRGSESDAPCTECEIEAGPHA